MSDPIRIFPVEPMVAFYAAVEAVADKKVGEVDMDFRVESPDGYEIYVSLCVRRDPKPFVITSAIQKMGEKDEET